MNKALKKSLSWLLVLATLFSLCAAMSVSVAAATPLDLGKAGASITARYYPDTQTLALTGSGPMYDYITDSGEDNLYDAAKTRPWHNYAASIKIITMSEGITTVGNAAFYYLINLEKCDIPTTVQTIGQWSFARTNMTSVTIPVKTTLVKHFAFSGTKLNEGLPSTCLGRTTIENKSVTAYDSDDNTTISGIASSSNSELINDLDPRTSTSYNVDASGSFNGIDWSYSTQTKTLKLYNNRTSVIPMTGLTNMRPWDEYMSQIRTVEIGDNIESIDDYAFAGAVSLYSVDLTKAEDLAKIGKEAFAGCNSLTSLQLPAATLTIAADAFSSRSSQITISTKNTEAVMTPGNACASDPYITWRYGVATTTTPSSPTGETFGMLTENGVIWLYSNGKLTLTAVQQQATIPDFADLSLVPWVQQGLSANIQSVEIGTGILSIGKNAFAGLPYLTSVTIGANVQMIGERAFAEAVSLTSVNLPASVLMVGSNAFDNSGLLYATKANENMYIVTPNEELNNALNGQAGGTAQSGIIPGTALSWIYQPTTQTLQISGTGEIPDYTSYTQTPWAAAGLNVLVKTLYVSPGVTRIGANAFVNMPQLTTVSLGTGLQSIGQFAFAQNTALTSIVLPASLLGVESYAFLGCSALTSAVGGNAALLIVEPNDELLAARNQSGGTQTPPTSGSNASGFFGSNNSLKWEYYASTNQLMIYTVSSTTTSAVIPDFSTAAPAPWTSLNSSIVKVSIGNGISTIGRYAFANMPYLQQVEIGKDVRIIGNYAFYNNIRLSFIAFPQNVATVASDAFTGCSSLLYATAANVNMYVADTNVELKRALNAQSTPSTPGTSGNVVYGQISGTNLTWSYDMNTNFLSITGSGAIPDYSATNPAPWNLYASAIKAITMQTGVTAIGASAFSGITQVIDLYIPDTVTMIGNEAFAGCTALQTIRLPQELSWIGSGAFRSCSSLKTIDIPDRITAINDYTFRDCVSLASVDLPIYLQTIGIEAFYGCTALKQINFPSILNTVGARAFSGCTALEDVVIRSTNLRIGADAFANCLAIQKAVYETNLPTTETGNDPLIRKYIARYSGNSSGNISWTADRAEGTLTISGTGEVTSSAAWKSELQYVDTLVFASGITGLGANLLQNDRDVVHVKMADTVTSIGASTFEGCTKLQSVELSKNLSTLGARAFYGCAALSAITLPDSLKVLPENAFSYCTGLETVNMGQGLMMIGSNAFANCMLLDDVVLPASLRMISTGAFNDCISLTNLELHGGSINDLSKDTFDNCNLLRVVRFHGSKAEWDKLVLNADPEIATASVTYYVRLTVKHVYKGGPLDGQAVATADTFSDVSGTSVTIAAKTCDTNYEVDAFTSTATLGTENSEVTITYSPKTYTLTIHCVDAKTGNVFAELEAQQVKYASSFEAKAATIEGYTAVDDRIYVESMPGDYTYEVKYNKNVYTYTVEYYNTQTEKVFETKEYQAEHGSSVTAETPALTGYTLQSGTYKIDKLTKDGQKITVKYKPDQKTLTIVYVDTLGNKLAEDHEMSVYYGEQVMVASPAITGKAADQEVVTLEAYNGEEKITVTYDWRYYTVTIRFVEKDSYGYEIRPAYVKSVKHGDPFTFTMDASYNEAAYVTDKTTVTFASVTSDITETVTYSPKPLKLTVEYKNADGKLLGTAEQTVYAGQSYTVEDHAIKNYLQTEEPVTGTMGIEDKTITVELEKDPDARSVGKVIAVIVIIVLVLGTGGALFYFLYLKKKPY